jgi:transcriptional regulator with XRE-family HTH domain
MNRGERIRARRKELGISQAELARMLSKTRSLISYIEKTGKVNDLTYFDIAQRIGIAFLSEDEQFLSKRFSPEKSSDNEHLRNLELDFLRRENDALKEIISLQKNVIDLLRKAEH